MNQFKLHNPFLPQGDQPEAIRKLTAGLLQDRKEQVLLGVTGSGKTFTLANVIQNVNKPTLIISPNKTLAAQLYSEFREFFPNNAVEYFVSYYDYYQPEAYIPQKDIYIEKDSAINQDIDRLRLSATASLLSRRDVVVIASVSSIYGLGSPETYAHMKVDIEKGMFMKRDCLMQGLIDMQYDRNDVAFERGQVRVRGDVVELRPTYEKNAVRVSFFGDEVESIQGFDPLTGEVFSNLEKLVIFPAKHYVVPEEVIERVMGDIRADLVGRVIELRDQGKILEAQRLNGRTNYDLEMIAEVGYCSGIENYSRYFDGRRPGERPYCLFDYFPKDYLLVIDESHVAVPQIRGMYNGDRSRKQTLVEHGFRLPSALDNRPLNFDEFLGLVNQIIYVSATPAPYELERCGGEVVEQVIRPTGILDPNVRVEPAGDQVPKVIEAVKKRQLAGERALITTLTKKLSEDLAFYMEEQGIKVHYLHSEVQTIERVEILKGLRKGEYDCIVGVNLLREGLDLPEVSLVAILDADKEGFLRSETSLIQTIGRAARNVKAEVILYADKITGSMERAMRETARRRKLQEEYNREHNITPKTIQKSIGAGIEDLIKSYRLETDILGTSDDVLKREENIRRLEEEMFQAAEDLEFEKAAYLRDQIGELQGKSKKARKAKTMRYKAR